MNPVTSAVVLGNYTLDRWHTPADEGRPLRDAATGEQVAGMPA
jgi:hypothetical protein